MRIFKTRGFARFAKVERINDAMLADAIRHAEAGLMKADLGGGLIKLRVARLGQGKRGGYRTLIAYRSGVRAVFLFGFAKNERDNVSRQQLTDLKSAAGEILKRSNDDIATDIADGRLQEVHHEETNQKG